MYIYIVATSEEYGYGLYVNQTVRNHITSQTIVRAYNNNHSDHWRCASVVTLLSEVVERLEVKDKHEINVT